MSEVHIKVCSFCKTSQTIFSFYKNKKSKDGFNWHCISCTKERSKKQRIEDSERQKEHKKRWYEKNKHRHGEYYIKNKDKVLEANRKWAENNRGLSNAIFAKRRAAKKQALPNWLTVNQLNEIKDIYSTCPEGYHVDHIVPLQGKNVCGLHVPWNLQHLPAKENIKKGNKF